MARIGWSFSQPSTFPLVWRSLSFLDGGGGGGLVEEPFTKHNFPEETKMVHFIAMDFLQPPPAGASPFDGGSIPLSAVLVV